MNLRVLAVAAALALPAAAQVTEGTAFTYQGSLKLNGQALNQTADLRFRLFDAAAGGTQVGSQLVTPGVAVSGGLFTVALDFGAGVYADGNARWLEIDARSPAGSGTYTTLPTRQALTATPFALNTRGIAVDSGGSVGIGTNNPTNRLNVVSNGDNNCIVAIDSGVSVPWSSTLRFNDRGNPEWSLNKNTSNDFTIRNANLGTDYVYITYFGNVGIGTSSPSNLLSVNGDANFNGLLGLGTNAPTHRLSVVGAADISGNVGIGTTSPQSKLEVDGGGGITVATASGFPRIQLATDPSISGSPAAITGYNGNGQSIFFLGASQFVGGSTAGLVGVTAPGGNTVRAGFYWSTANLQADMFAEAKFFRIENPRQAGTDIVYGCIEGPEVAAYVRGTGRLVNGRAVILLPDHFQDVAVSEGMTVQLTPCWAGSLGLAVVSEATDHFEVAELQGGTGTYDFHWRVEAVRRGHEDHQGIRPTAERMVGGGK